MRIKEDNWGIILKIEIVFRSNIMLYQNNKSIQQKLVLCINVLSSMYIVAFAFLPLFRETVNSGIFRFIFALVAIVWVITSICIKKNWLQKSLLPLFLLTPYFAFVTIYYVFNNGDMEMYNFINILFVVLSALMGMFYSEESCEEMRKIILSLCMLFFFITCITSIYALLENMNLSRELTSSSSSFDKVELRNLNIGSYDFIYASLILIPSLIMKLKIIKPIRLKLFLLISMALSIVLIIISNFTIAILLLLLSVILFFMNTQKNVLWQVIILAILALIFLPFLKEIGVEVLSAIQNFTPSILMQIKMQSIIDWLNGYETLGSSTSRSYLVKNSIESFFSNPILGVGGFYDSFNVVGGHSQFIDDYARYGIIGGTSVVLGVFMFFKNLAFNFKNSTSKNTYYICCMYFAILGFLNPIYGYSLLIMIYLVIPVLIKEI